MRDGKRRGGEGIRGSQMDDKTSEGNKDEEKCKAATLVPNV